MLDRPDAATAAALARLYDLDLSEDPGDLDLYLALADRADGPILELAAGTGRLAVPLAAAGHEVTAVDLDPAMLQRGRARAGEVGIGEDRIRFEEADLVDLRLPDAGRYALRCKKGPRPAFAVRGPLNHAWQVEDSNLCSFRDGFTVRSHWPLGQPAGWCCRAWRTRHNDTKG